MQFFSTKGSAGPVGFRDAVIHGLAPDRGLYFPENIPVIEAEWFAQLDKLTHAEIAFRMMRAYVQPDIPEMQLFEILEDTLNFPIPLRRVEDNIFALELFHGPTLAFKDVGARFMSRCLQYFNRDSDREVLVLVATSGDTGSAVAQGFYGVEGVQVVVLYPEGKVSRLQEKQFASLGGNIHAIAVEGVFDDCQHLVKEAFLDPDLNNQLQLSSANSINVARWMPQSVYYAIGYGQIADRRDQVFSCVPSGNFGNLTAGLLAARMGLPIDKWIAATNVNDVVPEFLKTKIFRPRPSIQTIANAMDVGNPSNFSRLLALFDQDVDAVIHDLHGKAFSEDQIREAIRKVYEVHAYLLDPHGAIGYLGLKDHLPENATGFFIETAHPAKFHQVIEEMEIPVTFPQQLDSVKDREILSERMRADFHDFKDYLNTFV